MVNWFTNKKKLLPPGVGNDEKNLPAGVCNKSFSGKNVSGKKGTFASDLHENILIGKPLVW